MVATRFASDPDEAPASLYYAEGGSYQRAADSQASLSPLSAAAPGQDAAANAQTARRTSLTGTLHPGSELESSTLLILHHLPLRQS